MKTKTNKRKNILSVLVVMVMLVATLLTACSSGETAAAPVKEETPAVEATKEAEPVEEVKEDVAELEVTTEPETTEEAEPETTTEEVAEEPKTEAVVYEGIDMESTLPGIEWMDTFDGIINEPKMVIFNDETNKKVIVENEQEVEFSDTDTFAIYAPLNRDIMSIKNDSEAIFNKKPGEKYRIFRNISAKYKDGDKATMRSEYEVDGETVVLTATLIVKRD